MAKTNKGKLILLFKCAARDGKKSRLTKKEASGLLTSLALKIPLSKIPPLGNILF